MIDTSIFDSTAKRNVSVLSELLNYKPNNEKILAFHKSNAKTRLLLGGKRSGKSYGAAVETCWAGLGIHPYLDYPEPPLAIRYCSVDFINGIKGIILPLFKRLLGPLNEGPVCKKYWAEDRILELRNGTTIQFSSYDQELSKFEGVSRNLIVMDEEPPKDVYQSNFMRTVDCGGKLVIACTPIMGYTWLYYDLYDSPDAVPPAVEWWYIKTSENPHISAEEIEAIKRDPAMRDNLEVALEGAFVPKSNLVFPSFSYDNILQDFRLTEDHMVLVGIDPHDRNPWGVVYVALNRENEYIVYDEILESGTVDKLGRMIKSRVGHRKVNMYVIDTAANTVQSTSGVSIKDQLLRNFGIYCHDAIKDVQASVHLINSLLKPADGSKPRLFITKNCVHLTRQLRNTIWDDWARNKHNRDPKERILKRDDHLVDALRYVVMQPIVYRHPGFIVEPWRRAHASSVTGYY